MFCKYCGKKIDVDSGFCPYCGKELTNSTKSRVKRRPLKKHYYSNGNNKPYSQAFDNSTKTSGGKRRKPKKKRDYGKIAFVIGFIVICLIMAGIEKYQDLHPSNEAEYTSSSQIGDKVYMDIISIAPIIGVYPETSSTYTYFVCDCKTKTNTNKLICIKVSDYKKYFDSSVNNNVSNDSINEKVLSSVKRIHGVVSTADSFKSGLSKDTGELLFEFIFIDD